MKARKASITLLNLMMSKDKFAIDAFNLLMFDCLDMWDKAECLQLYRRIIYFFSHGGKKQLKESIFYWDIRGSLAKEKAIKLTKLNCDSGLLDNETQVLKWVWGTVFKGSYLNIEKIKSH